MPNQPKMCDSNCIICNKSFKTTSQNIKRGHGKFCSKECRLSKTQQNYNCSFCGKAFISGKSRASKSKTSTYFCSNECKYKAASSLENKYVTGPFGKTDGKSTYRTRALSLLKNKCSRCGYSKYIKLLDIDHIDGNRANNTIQNLQVLCVMCHAMKTRIPDEYQKHFGISIDRNCKSCSVTLENNKNFYCLECTKQFKHNKTRETKINWPSNEELETLLAKTSIIQISKNLGVTDNSVRKYCIKNGIDYRKLSPFSYDKILTANNK